MKNLILTTLLLSFSYILSAQTRLGVTIGSPTLSSYSASKDFYNKESNTLYKLNYLSSKTSFSYGLSLFNEIGDNWWLSADVLYRKRQVNYNVDLNQLARSSNLYTDHFTEVHVPIAAGFQKNNFKIGLGPTITMKAKSELSLVAMQGFTNNERKINTGFQFQLGYIIKDRIHLNFKKEIQFNGTGDEYQFDYKPLRLKTSPHTFSLGASIYL